MQNTDKSENGGIRIIGGRTEAGRSTSDPRTRTGGSVLPIASSGQPNPAPTRQLYREFSSRTWVDVDGQGWVTLGMGIGLVLRDMGMLAPGTRITEENCRIFCFKDGEMDINSYHPENTRMVVRGRVNLPGYADLARRIQTEVKSRWGFDLEVFVELGEV